MINLVGSIFGIFIIFLFLALTSLSYKNNKKTLAKKIDLKKQVPPPTKKERTIDWNDRPKNDSDTMVSD